MTMPDEHTMTGKIAEDARSAWESRYAARGPGSDDHLIAALRRDDQGLMSWDPGGPYPGVDGARYQPGAMCLQDADEPFLIIEARGTSEVITGWAGFGQMQDWIAGRRTGGSRALTPAPVPAGTRTWLEDTVLAYAVNHPWDSGLGEALRALEPDAMTTDVRYEVLDAVRRLPGRGYYSPETVSAEARTRLSRVPAEGLARYGGPGGPFIRAYVSRLAETEIMRPDFRTAVQALQEEDRQARRRAAWLEPPVLPVRKAPGQRGTPDATAPGACPGLPPGHVPGPRTDPVQGR